LKKIRVGFFYNNKDFGGPVVNMRCFTRYLDTGRFQSVVFFSRRTVEIEPFIQEYNKLGIPVYFIPHMRPSISNKPVENLKLFTEAPSVLNGMIKLIKENHIDIVQTETIGDLQAMVAARIIGIPLVAHISEIYTKPRWATYMLSWLVYLLANKVICVSNAVRDTMFPFAITQDKISVLNNGINTDFYDPIKVNSSLRNEYSIKSHTKIIGIVGLLDPWKGQYIVLESIPQVLKKHPDVIFLFIGGESKKANAAGYRHKLYLRAQELGIINQVIFTGFREDIKNVLAGLNFFIHASISPDPFPTTVLEAMSMEKPVIASKSGGVLEQIEDGKDGILITPNNSEELAHELDILLSNPARAESLGKEGRLSVMKKFKWEKKIIKLTEIYEELFSHAK
jgi:glycosyltransferase involved in cell wall biosynthesis